MAENQEWVVAFYMDDQGHNPILEFLDGLDQKTKARFDWSIEQLRQRNVHATEPLVKHLEDKIWELRRASQGNIYRLLYFFFSGRRIVFVHGFVKKTQKTPRRELEIAQQRMKAYMLKQGGDSK